MNGISVIICCYNSADRIDFTIHHLLNQKIQSAFPWEIIVINNGSADNTRGIVSSLIQKNDSNVRILLIDETLPGLINARRCGIEHAQYNILVFCDDDNHLEEGYIETAFNLMGRRPEVAIAGGWCKPKLPFYPGKWIESNFAALAIEPSPRSEGYVDWVFGAGMIIRKELFSELHDRGIQMMLTGRLQEKQTSGDDAEICHLARFLDHRIYYCPALVLDHNVSAHRLTRWNFIKANYRNVFMMVYFFLLDKLMTKPENHLPSLYNSFLRSRIKNVFYYVPRMLFGKSNFFSFMMFYQNIQLVYWILFRKEKFEKTYIAIKNNLYGDMVGR